MKTSTKIIATVAATLALGAGGLVFAHQGQGGMGNMGPGMGMQGGGHGGMRGAEGDADITARLATVKNELKITTAQEPAWQKFEGVVRQQADARRAMRSTMQARMQDPNAAASIDHAAQRDSMMKLREGNRAERDAARQALYAVLTPEQKTLADQKLSAGHGRRHHMSMHAPVN